MRWFVSQEFHSKTGSKVFTWNTCAIHETTSSNTPSHNKMQLVP